MGHGHGGCGGYTGVGAAVDGIASFDKPGDPAPTPGHTLLDAWQHDQFTCIRGLAKQLNDEITTIATRNHDAMPSTYDATTKDEIAAVERSNAYLFEARRRLQVGLMWLSRTFANPPEF